MYTFKTVPSPKELFIILFSYLFICRYLGGGRKVIFMYFSHATYIFIQLLGEAGVA